jgi:eukaryotic-like serine/threonine-protein kinase
MNKTVSLLVVLIGISGVLTGQQPYSRLNQITVPIIRIAVPPLIGRNIDVAFRLLDSLGLTRGEIAERNSNQSVGNVIDQFPAPGSLVDRGTRVNLTVSLGPQRIIVPSVIGKTLEEAQMILSANQLRTGQVRSQLSKTESGRVISQNPEPGRIIRLGTSVDLTIAEKKSPNYVIVPDVKGWPLQTAKTIITRVGLKVEIIKSQNDNAEQELIIKQIPSAGEKVRKGSFIKLYVDQTKPPSWPYYGGGIAGTVLLAAYLALKFRKLKQNKRFKKEPGLELKIIPDKGKQSFHPIERDKWGLQLTIIPDRGKQTIKN